MNRIARMLIDSVDVEVSELGQRQKPGPVRP
jgi:hypothetical protein